MNKWIIFFALCLVSLEGAGLFVYEMTPNQVGLASAGWTVRAFDPSTVITNPAGLTELSGKHLLFSPELLYTNIEFFPSVETTVAGEAGESNNWIPAGSLFYSQSLTENLTVGFGTFSTFGSVLEYNNGWVGRYYCNEARLQALSAALSVAYKVNDVLSIGGGWMPSYTLFKFKSSVNNTLDSLPDGELRLKDQCFSHAGFAGLILKFNDCTRFGVEYISPTTMRLTDTPELMNIGPGLLALLEASGLATNPFNLTVRNPQMVMAGFYHRFNDVFSLMGDLGWQQWSDYGWAEIVVGSTTQMTLTIPLQFKDCWHGALGLEMAITPSFVATTGFAYDTSILSDDQRTPSMPIGQQWRFGFGLRYDPTCFWKYQLAYELNWSGDLPMDVTRGPLAGHVTGDYQNTAVHVLSAAVERVF